MPQPKLYPTPYLILRPGASPEGGTIEWPREPGYTRLKAFMTPILGPEAWFERVSVGDSKFPRDMLVDEEGLLKGLCPNSHATLLYRGTPHSHHGIIVGPAVVFERRVWF